MQRSHKGCKCDPAGFVINSLYLHVGTCGDGFIEGKWFGRGLLEVKCPLSYEDINTGKKKKLMYLRDKPVEIRCNHDLKITSKLYFYNVCIFYCGYILCNEFLRNYNCSTKECNAFILCTVI